jgi:1-acyl-sn-glycerol-3-phosphate acyltransferase
VTSTERRPRRQPWLFHLCRPFLFLAAHYHRLEVVGIDHAPTRGPALLLVKHRATRDSLLLSWILYHHAGRMAYYLVKSKSPLYNRFVGALGGIGVIRPKDLRRIQDRAQRRAALQRARRLNRQTLDYVAELYIQGELVIIYPEGMFYPTRLGPLHLGALRQIHDLAPRCEIPIVPVGVEYQALRRPRSRVYVRFGAPLSIADYPELSGLADVLTDQLRGLSGLNS